MMYVKIGEKKNGKYSKGEEFSLDEFRELIKNGYMIKFKDIKYTWFDKLMGKPKKTRFTNWMFLQGYNISKEHLITYIRTLIKKDRKGIKIKDFNVTPKKNVASTKVRWEAKKKNKR